MTTLYNGTLYLQGLNDVVPGDTGITSADTILSVLNNIQTNASSRIMMEIGSYNVNVANGTPIYKYLMGYTNSATGGYYTIDGVTKSSSVRFLTMYQSGGAVQVGINTTSPSYTLDVNGSIHAATTLTVDNATTLKNTLSVQSATTLSNTLNVASATTLSNTLAVGSATTLSNTLNVQGAATLDSSLTIGGKTTFNNTTQFAVNTWNTSSDGYNRVYYANVDRTYFGSPTGYTFQNNFTGNILSIENTGSLSLKHDIWHTSMDGYNRLYYGYGNQTVFSSPNGYVFYSANTTHVLTIENTGAVYFKNDVWHRSINDGHDRIHFANGGATTFKSLSGYAFQNSAGVNKVTINSDGDIGASRNISASGKITATGNITTSGNISTSGIFYGNGSGLTNITAATATTATSATTATNALFADSLTITGAVSINGSYGFRAGNNTIYYIIIPSVTGLYLYNLRYNTTTPSFNALYYIRVDVVEDTDMGPSYKCVVISEVYRNTGNNNRSATYTTSISSDYPYFTTNTNYYQKLNNNDNSPKLYMKKSGPSSTLCFAVDGYYQGGPDDKLYISYSKVG